MKIGIVGAGRVGCACALAAVVRGSARTIVIVDRTRKRAEAVATDLRYGAPLCPKTTVVDRESRRWWRFASAHCPDDAGLSSKHRQPAATLTTRESGINPCDIGLRQLYIGRAGILFDMLDAGRFWGREDRRPPRQKCKRNLARGRVMRPCDILEQAAARRVLAWKIAMPEWTIRGDVEMVLLAPG